MFSIGNGVNTWIKGRGQRKGFYPTVFKQKSSDSSEIVLRRAEDALSGVYSRFCAQDMDVSIKETTAHLAVAEIFEFDMPYKNLKCLAMLLSMPESLLFLER